MEREDYQVLTIKYSEMRDRFVKGRKMGWAMLLILLFIGIPCGTLMGPQIDSEVWEVFCKTYSIVTVIVAVITNLKLILSKKLKYTEVDVAFYVVTNVGLVMLGTEIICIGIAADTAAIPALIFGGISVSLCVGFWITVRMQNYKQLREGAFRGKKYNVKLPKSAWIWFLTAIPIIPLLSLHVRKVWFVSLNESLRVLILMYAILWFWMVLIYSLFVQAVMFIKLEYKMRRKEKNDSKKENVSNE
ncbi:hypothetical protein [Roseburia sp. 499]|uniref:hypothetical protein n=1 Tax=Roseburia sp. 499 TaxID=1261634 RepID=UPI000951BA1C|nr:hypothetical protein [Roseburia sp. 499]WVK69531.1 hypothetical protein BIV20_14410 [Roseburia sp. 499]